MVTPPKQPQKRPYHQHGLHTLQKALAQVGSMDAWLTEQGEIGEALRAKRNKMIEDQGGDKISELERDAIDDYIKLKLISDSVWRYIAGMPCPVNKVKRQLFSVVPQGVDLVKAGSEARKDLHTLREKRPKPEPVLIADYLTGKTTPTTTMKEAATAGGSGESQATKGHV